MKLRSVLILTLVAALAGCGRVQSGKTVLARVNDYEITREEFDSEFKNFIASGYEKGESQKAFLDDLIDKKLILQEAQRKGLDRGPKFLRMVERSWEQTLLRLAIERKMKQIAGSYTVSDAEVQKAYDAMVKSGKTEKPYDQVYGQIMWELSKRKESELIDAWLKDLHRRAKVDARYELLEKK